MTTTAIGTIFNEWLSACGSETLPSHFGAGWISFPQYRLWITALIASLLVRPREDSAALGKTIHRGNLMTHYDHNTQSIGSLCTVHSWSSYFNRGPVLLSIRLHPLLIGPCLNTVWGCPSFIWRLKHGSTDANSFPSSTQVFAFPVGARIIDNGMRDTQNLMNPRGALACPQPSAAKALLVSET